MAELYSQMKEMEENHRREVSELMEKHLAEVEELEEGHQAEMRDAQKRIKELEAGGAVGG